jgi:hypothetical protein
MHASLPCPSVPRALPFDIAVLNQAIVDGDLDCARQCLIRLRERHGTSLCALGRALDRLASALGPVGMPPAPGLGTALTEVVGALEQHVRRST